MLPYILYTPSGSEFSIKRLLADRYNVKYIHENGWKYYYLYSKVLKSYFHSDARWVRLHSQELKELLGRVTAQGKQEYFYLRARRELADWGVLRCHTEQAGSAYRKAFYRIDEEVASVGFVVADVKVPHHLLKRKARRVIDYAGVHDRLQRSFRRATIQVADALAIARHALVTQAELTPSRSKKYRHRHHRHPRHMDAAVYSRWLALIQMFRTGETYFRINKKNGRASTSFATFPKLLRQTIRLGGAPLCEVDVSACQLLLLTKLVVEYCAAQDIPPGDDLRQWQALSETGETYRFLYANFLARGTKMESMGESGAASAQCTKALKVEFFAKVVFAKERDSPMRRAFHDLFPTVSAAIRFHKQPDHRRLAVRLQRMESDLMLGTVCARLYELNHKDLLTVHDAIYCPAGLVQVVVREIKTAFAETGLCVQVKVDGVPA